MERESGQQRVTTTEIGYSTCSACFIGQHDQCDGEARIHHVGGAVETVTCEHRGSNCGD